MDRENEDSESWVPPVLAAASNATVPHGRLRRAVWGAVLVLYGGEATELDAQVAWRSRSSSGQISLDHLLRRGISAVNAGEGLLGWLAVRVGWNARAAVACIGGHSPALCELCS